MRIHISSDGKSVKSLYHDKSPLRKLGKVQIQRASHVEYDNKDGLWYVYAPNGAHMIKAGFQNRADAIKAEIDFLEDEMRLPKNASDQF